MTRKDFILIAGVIRNSEMDAVDKRRLVSNFCLALRHTNTAFNPDKFLDACYDSTKGGMPV
jgi:hypothetical protein